MLLKIIGVALIGVLLSIIVKNVKPEISIVIGLVTIILILSIIIKELSSIVTFIKIYFLEQNLTIEIFNFALKVLGVGYLIEFTSEIAEENGYKSIASKVLFAGKIIIFSLCLPYLLDLFTLIKEML